MAQGRTLKADDARQYVNAYAIRLCLRSRVQQVRTAASARCTLYVRQSQDPELVALAGLRAGVKSDLAHVGGSGSLQDPTRVWSILSETWREHLRRVWN